MNRKAFTLVELLAVIVILALLALLTSVAVTTIINDSKKDISNTQYTLIKSTAEMWGSENLDKMPPQGSCSFITLQDLKDEGLINNSIIDSSTNEEIPNDLKIKIATTASTNGKSIYTYEVNPESVDGCKDIFPQS